MAYVKHKQAIHKTARTAYSNMVELAEFKKGKNDEKMHEARGRFKTAKRERESNNRAFIIPTFKKQNRPKTDDGKN